MRARLVSWANRVWTRARPARLLLPFVIAPPLYVRTVHAQVNLPPPPPPPIDSNGGTTTPTNTGGTAPTHKPRPTPTHKAEPAHTAAPPPATHEPPPQYHAPEPERSPRTISIRLNPLPFFMSRLSADFEIMLAPHHALVVSPNLTLKKFAFHRGDVFTYGMGFAGDDNSGFGAEVGYHYWTKRELEGIYFGPSLVFGATLPPANTNGKTFAYVGGAIDVGYQYLFSNGFTLNGGGGVMLTGATAAGSTAKAAPRLLFGVGWSF